MLTRERGSAESYGEYSSQQRQNQLSEHGLPLAVGVAILLQHPSAPAHQVDDQYHQRQNQKKVDQPTGNMEAEAK